MKRQLILFSILVLALAMLRPLVQAASVNDFIDFSLRNENNQVVLPGRLHVPVEYALDPSAARPLILFLPGTGESGTDNLKQINGNIDNLLAGAKQRGAFLYAPQNVGSFANSFAIDRTLTMIDRATAEFGVDPRRIYITGISQGGGDVFYFVDQNPERFAAAVPIAGGLPNPFFMATHTAGEPLWAFHARDDGASPVQNSRYIISKILESVNEPVPTFPPLSDRASNFQFDNQALDLHYTEFAQGGHGIWPAVYQRMDMYDWLFSHVQVPEPCSGALLGIAALLMMCRSGRWTR